MARKWGLAAVPYLVERLDAYGVDVAVEAAIELGKLKDPRATDALVRPLGDRFGSTRFHGAEEAADALGQICDPKSIPALLKAIKDKLAENGVRISAAGALTRMGRDEGLKYLLAMLKSSEWGDRFQVAHELGLSRIKGTLKPLIALLADDSMDVRERAAWALGELNDPRAIPALKKLRKNGPCWGDVEIATKILEKFGVKSPPASQPGNP